LAFVIYLVFQTAWALNTTVHLEFVVMAFNFLMLIYLLQSTVKTRDDLVVFCVITMMGCSYFTYIGLTSSWGGRLDGIGAASIASSNQMAQHVAAMLMPGAFLLMQRQQSWWRYGIVLFLSAACLKVILMAGSRGVYLGILITAIIALIFYPKGSKKRLYFFAALGVSVGLVFIGPTLMQRFGGVQLTNLGEATDQSARSRVVILEAQWEMFKQAPLLGHGHKGTLLMSPIFIPKEYLSRNASEGLAGRASHNYLMSLLVDHGLVGASILLIIIFRCLVPLRRLSRQALVGEADSMRLLVMGLMLGLLCLVIAGMASDHKNSETSIWFFALIPLFLKKIELKVIEHAA
jgi:O-antigen ligase